MNLPTGYTEVQYIQSTGIQYVDTEFKPNQDSHVIIKLSTSETGSHTIFGADLSWTDNGFALGTEFTHYGKETGTISGLNNGSPHEVDFNKNTISIDGSVVLTMGTSTFSISHNMTLFANNRAGGVSEKTTMALYYCQIYNGNTIVRKYIPCINPDGDAGLYDTINSKFYGNSGTGVFFAGPPKVKLPSGYKQLEYIQSSGTQYIDTGFIPNQDSRLIIDVQLLATSGYPSIFGTRNSNGWMFWCYANSATEIIYGYDSNKFRATCTMSDRLLIDANKNIFLVNGGALITDTARSFTAKGNLYLHATNNAGTLQYASQMKSYFCKLYDNGTLIRDFIPCSNPSGAIGLYDLANNKFYANAGTGVFTAGPEVTWPSNNAIYVKVNGIWKQIDGIKLL